MPSLALAFELPGFERIVTAENEQAFDLLNEWRRKANLGAPVWPTAEPRFSTFGDASGTVH